MRSSSLGSVIAILNPFNVLSFSVPSAAPDSDSIRQTARSRWIGERILLLCGNSGISKAHTAPMPTVAEPSMMTAAMC